MGNSKRAVIYMLLVGFFFGLIGVLVKLIDNSVHPISIVLYRLIIGFVFLLIFIPLVQKKSLAPKKENFRTYFILGLLVAGSMVSTVFASALVPVQNVVLLTNLYPFLVLFLASAFLKEKITRTKIVTLIIALVGISILNPFKVDSQIVGNLVAISHALVFSILVVWLRKEGKNHDLSVVLWAFLIAMIVIFPFAIDYGLGNPFEVWVYLLILGTVCTGLTYILHALALEDIDSELSSIIVMISMPISGIILANVILGEPMNSRVLVGGSILVFAGVYLESHSRTIRKIFANLYNRFF